MRGFTGKRPTIPFWIWRMLWPIPLLIDLPEENREAAVNAITLPEVFHDFDTAQEFAHGVVQHLAVFLGQ